MKRFKSLSIREKLIRAMVTITAAVLLPSVLLLIALDYILLRQATNRNLGILAESIAYSSAAALAFDDPEDASRILESFRAEPNIMEAILYDLNGEVFASYTPATASAHPMPDIPISEAVSSGGIVRYLAPVREGDMHLGWLLIHYNLKALRGRLILYVVITTILAAVSLGAAYALSILFQSRISSPILALERVARSVSERHDYSLRAAKTTEDEIGSLTDAFNEMLEQIASKEAALSLSEERLRIAVESSRIGVWDWDLKSGSASWVGSIYQTLGLQPKISGSSNTPFFDSIHADDRAEVEQAMKEAQLSGSQFEADFRMQGDGNNEIEYVRARGKCFLDNKAKPARMVGVIIDVSDLRLAEAEIRKLNRTLEERVVERTAELHRAIDEIEAFNYSVSHDLRAPLRSINGFSMALLEDYDDKIDATGQDFLRRIVTSCKRMSQLIDDLLQLSRVTRQEMRRQPIDLSALATEIVKNLRESAPNRQADIRIAKNLKAEGDPGLLTIVLENLLQNAWKFTSKKEQTKIEIGSEFQDGQQVFFIRDNGAGFDMQFSDKLFGVFHRLHKSTEFEGTGIGLATVRRILERHGGEIWATGVLDRGATFYFTINPE